MKFSWVGLEKERLRKPYAVADIVYITTNLSSQSKASTIRDLCEYFKLDSADIRFLVKATFDINDESAYNAITAGQLAYRLIEKLLVDGKLSAQEIDALKTKEYIRRTFLKVVYPVLANNREDNMGKGKKLRYYRKPEQVGGKDIFITSEWFDESRQGLIVWYKEHL